MREAAELKGHDIDIIDTMHCYMDITSAKPSVRYKGQALPHYDAIIPRIGASVTFYGTSVVRQFEMMGTYSINESVAISRSRDKLRSLQLLSRKSIGMPRTGFANHPDYHDVQRVVRREAPVVSRKIVKSSTATRERRFVITTPITMNETTWDIQLTLTDRSNMTYLMLLGREAMQDRFVVDPSVEYILGHFVTG